MQLRLVRRQAVGLNLRFADTVMPAGELNAANAQRRAQPLRQLGLDCRTVFVQQSCEQRRPASFDDFSIGLEKLVHGASRSLQAKK